MEKLVKVTPVTETNGIIQISRRGNNYDLGTVRQAYTDGKFRRESAGPGWGTHNAILYPIHNGLEVLNDCYEPWWSNWLATFEEGE